MVIKLFQDLLNMAIKMSNKKVSYYRKKSHVLEETLRSSKKTIQHWLLHLGKTAPCVACHQGSAQAVDTVGLTALFLLVKVRSVPFYRKISQTWMDAWIGPKVDAVLCGWRLNPVLLWQPKTDHCLYWLSRSREPRQPSSSGEADCSFVSLTAAGNQLLP